MNLPGGVRCSYCGAALPPSLDFEIGVGAGQAAVLPGPTRPIGAAQPRRAGLLGLLAVLALKVKSLLALLKFGKILLTLSTMLLFLSVESRFFGWQLAAGFTLCIFVHEMGHVVVNWRKGIPASAPMFIPFVGALISVRKFPDDPTAQSECGAGGPAAGMLAALVCLVIGLITHSPFWLVLAQLGFVINLFNLIPFPPLDGSHIATVFSPAIWDLVLIGQLLWVLKLPSEMLWMILIVGFLFRLGRGQDDRFQMAHPTARLRMAAVYLVLCLGLAYGIETATNALPPLDGHSTVTRSHSAASSPAAARSQAAEQAPPSTADSQEELSSPSTQLLLFWGERIGLVVAAVGLWLLTAYLLAAATGRSLGGSQLSLTACMLGLLAALFLAAQSVPFLTPYFWPLAYAYLAAAIAAVCGAGYLAAHRQTLMPHPAAALARCLAWAAVAALLVAYALNSLGIAFAVALCALAFYARHPWMPAGLLGTLAEQMGDVERSLTLRRRAIARHPDPESARSLQMDIARLSLALARGGEALEALQARDMASTGFGQIERRSIAEWDLYAAAVTLLDRFEEALAGCEQMLQAPPQDPLSQQRLFVTQARLAEIARLRGWPDESLARADTALRVAPRTARKSIATLRGRRAAALIAQGQIEAARAECDLALKMNREPAVQAWIDALRAQAALTAGDTATAERETAAAARLLPGHLEIGYWRGRILLAAGRREAGETTLRQLAERFPQEHWGRQAAAELALRSGVVVTQAGRAPLDSPAS